MQKRLLIIGASILQLPAIIRAKELGYYVGTLDINPKAVGIPYADEYYNISTIDVEGVINTAKTFKPDGILTIATDMPMRAVACATAELNLPGITLDTAIKATDKGEMIKAFEKHNVEHPWYYIVEDKYMLETLISKITYPCVMKPTDNAGNRGVCYIENRQQLIEQYKYSYENSRSGHVIIEEYMEGQEVSVEIIVWNNNVNILAVTDKKTLGKPYFVEIGHSEQSQLPQSDIAKIKDLATRAVLSLGINNSPAHVEIMLTKDGPKMVELGARLGGGCITTHLVPLSTGVDMIKCVIDLSLGIEPDVKPRFNKGSALRHITTDVDGIIAKTEGVEAARKISGIREVTLLKNIGDHIQYFMNGSDRIGYVIAQGNNTQEAIDICDKALEKIKITLS